LHRPRPPVYRVSYTVGEREGRGRGAATVRNPATKQRARLAREQLEREAWLGRQLLAMLGTVRICNLYNDGEVIRAEVTDVRGKSRSVEERDVRDLLLAAAGVEVTKKCHGRCKRVLPLSSFGRDKNKPDGRLLRCKRCEAERVRQYKGKKTQS
jgi:hypothetical protein